MWENRARAMSTGSRAPQGPVLVSTTVHPAGIQQPILSAAILSICDDASVAALLGTAVGTTGAAAVYVVDVHAVALYVCCIGAPEIHGPKL